MAQAVTERAEIAVPRVDFFIIFLYDKSIQEGVT